MTETLTETLTTVVRTSKINAVLVTSL